MRKYLKTLILFCLVYQTNLSQAQYVSIPDLEFRTFLMQNGFSSCISGNSLDTTCGAMLNETFLYINYTDIKDLTGIHFFKNLVFLNVNDNDSLNYIPELPKNLETFNCSRCNFSSLPALGDSLIDFGCYQNQLTVLPVLPNGLRSLGCSINPLTSLPTLTDSLRVLSANQCLLTSLPALPPFLEGLNISQNQIDTIVALPNTIEIISCYGNPLSTLPALPDSLTTLTCGGSPTFSSLPSLPNKLYRLLVESASLTSLPQLPASLEEFWCDHNQITALPSPLPPGLRYLICADNQISSLPSLPSSIIFLGCNDNLLASLPTLPPYLQQLNAYNNPNLTCLPQLNTIGTLLFGNTAITCLPNYGTVANSTPLLSSLPLCDLFNTNGCNAYWNISGKAYVDTNFNCINNSNELQAPNIKVSIDSAGVQIQQTYTGNEGYYSFDTDTGIYVLSVDTLNLPVEVTCPVSIVQNVALSALDSMEYDVNFGLRCKPGFDVGILSLGVDSGNFRPARYANIVFNAGDMTQFYGLNCASGISGSIKIVKTGPGTWISSAQGALNPVISNDTFIYNITDFGTLNGVTDLVYKIQTDTLSQTGDLICFSIEVFPYSGDNNIINNNYQRCFIINNSYDPNNKVVFPSGNIDTSITKLDYTINFQNTGTASAEHIYIIDTLDANLMAGSFELTAYSHVPQIQITGSVVRFNFPNINLPDSVSNEPASHGFISYRVKLQPGLALGTAIENTAHIFFDFNTPMATNTTINTIQQCNLMPQSSFTINDTLLCEGDLLIADAAIVIPTQATWYINSKYAGTGLSIQTDTLSAGTHWVELVLNNAVCSQILRRSVQILEPVQPIININGNNLISSSNSGNQWYYNGNLLTGATSDTLIIVTGGWFMVVATDLMGCVAFSDSVFISLVGNIEIQNGNLHLVPNPFLNEFTIIAPQNQDGDVTVSDIHSRILFRFSGKLDGLKIPGENWNKGIYTVTMLLKDSAVVKKMVKY